MEKIKLVESFKVSAKAIKKLPITESYKKISYREQDFTCLGAYTFPISIPDEENLNERFYSSELWDNVLNNQKEVWEGSFGLCDHPEEEGSVKDIYCVWHNLRYGVDDLGKKIVFADAYLFGQWGMHCKEAIEAGGLIGLSTVGWGDLEKDKKTVIPESYEIERPADWVLNPSYQVYGTKEDEIRSSLDVKIEDIKESKEKESRMKIKEEKLKKLEEKNLVRMLKNSLEEIKEKEDSREKLADLKEMLTYWEDIDFALDMKEEIEEEVSNLTKHIEDTFKKGKDFDKLAEDKLSFEERYYRIKEAYTGTEKKYNCALSLLDDIKKHCRKVDTLYEEVQATKNTMFTADEYGQLEEQISNLLSDIEKLEESLTLERKTKRMLEKQLARIETRIRENKIRKEKRNLALEERRKKAMLEDRRRAALQEKRNLIIERKRRKHEEEVSLDFTEKNEIKRYYEDLKYNDPEIAKEIKEEIFSCKTLSQAQLTYMKLKDEIDKEWKKFNESSTGKSYDFTATQLDKTEEIF
ncbi:MAG: hypothetical protein GF311_28380 [Candidatus Lokiarchaeota archaeon]|nr:hypothetical protein [Candidatus Lokiarchaeota archaeon]